MKVELKKILCPIDFSRNAAYATQYAVMFAETHGAELLLLQVHDPYVPCHPIEYPGVDGDVRLWLTAGMEEGVVGHEEPGDDLGKSLQRLAADLHERHPDVNIRPLRAPGKPFVAIVRAAEEYDVDLIVMGTQGRTRLMYTLIGGTAEKVVRMTPCPVLIVKHPKHKSVTPCRSLLRQGDRATTDYGHFGRPGLPWEMAPTV
ncbi:MAG: universal stress protein [Kiritimatiellae bacterium]|nr:universal stress protein [Kiritimatiellia bacterium]